MDAVHIKVTALTEETRRGMSRLQKQQFPFALAKTLTEVASMSVRAVQSKTRREFELHGEFIPRGIARTPARKSDVRRLGIGTTVVFTKPLISGFMPIHETGGVREPAAKSGGRDKGVYLAHPGKDLKKKSYKTSTGRIRERWKLKTLLKNYKRQRLPTAVYSQIIQGKVRRTKGQPFIARHKVTGTPMLMRRTSTARYPVDVLYVFVKRAKYTPQWDFEDTVYEIVDRRFKQRLYRNLQVAVATAR